MFFVNGQRAKVMMLGSSLDVPKCSLNARAGNRTHDFFFACNDISRSFSSTFSCSSTIYLIALLSVYLWYHHRCRHCVCSRWNKVFSSELFQGTSHNLRPFLSFKASRVNVTGIMHPLFDGSETLKPFLTAQC